MSIFAKKPEWEQKVMAEVGSAPQQPQLVPKGAAYGIGDAITLLRSLPVDAGGGQNAELVVRVVRATLASLHVHLPDIIEDATKKQKYLAERMAAEHAQVAELERQLESHRREIAAIEADLKETTSVKERLQQAERSASLSAGGPSRTATTPGAAAAATRASSANTPGPELLARPTHDEASRLKD